MYPSYPPGTEFKIFVKEKSETQTNLNKNHQNQKYLPIAPLTGERAKEFYENILKELSEEKKAEVESRTKLTLSPAPGKIYKNSDLLWMAQNNDVKNLVEFFSQKHQTHDVNVVDEFGWTPLMCAACSGAERAVLILLKNGADPQKRDRLGNSALHLAVRKNRHGVVKILKNYKEEVKESEESEQDDPIESFFCSVCKENLKTRRRTHETSTLHLFNSQHKPRIFYGIPESNKGFQLLLRKGWDKERGLGRDGTGRIFPVKAVMKKDRKGIGAPPQPPPQPRNKQNKKPKNKWREKDFEKNFRLEFS